MQSNQDLDALVADLTRKGYSASQIRAVSASWDAACREGTHPALAEAAHAAVDDLEIRRLTAGDPGLPAPGAPDPAGAGPEPSPPGA
ncbi:MAG: hypothetical protein ACRDJO_03725 [Actinomycetota bacterium]